MSYLGKIRRLGRDANPFFCLMGIEVVSFGEGKARLRMVVRNDMLNGEGYLQGGMFAALADEAMVLAIYSVMDDNQVIATISESTGFMRGANQNSILIADGRVIKKGRRVIFAESDVRLEGREDIASRSSAAYAITNIENRTDIPKKAE